MTILHRLGLLFLGAAVPVLVAAAAPQNVTGITAINENGKVRVMWQQVTGQQIAQYRIFYSHTSILGNNGLYDDFETVDGSVNTHLLQNIPPVSDLYVSVLAVNAAGEESPYFVQEASVKMGTAQTTSSAAASSAAASQQTVSSTAAVTSSAASSVATTQQNVLRLLGAEAISATGVTLRFSHNVTIAQAQAAQAVMIETASGTRLMLKRFVMQGTNLTVHTEQQTRGIVYRLTLGAGVTGTANGVTISLDPQQGPTLFTGHATGKAPMTGGSTSSIPAMMDHPDITQLRLVAQPDGVGTYTVEGTWQAPAGQGVTGYMIAQTTDGGRTYSAPRPIGTQSAVIKIPKVPAGTFGLRVQAQYSDGMLSRGVTQVISLPRGGTQGSVTNPATGSGALPNSGPALWLAVAGSGAIVGAYRARVRRMQKA